MPLKWLIGRLWLKMRFPGFTLHPSQTELQLVGFKPPEDLRTEQNDTVACVLFLTRTHCCLVCVGACVFVCIYVRVSVDDSLQDCLRASLSHFALWWLWKTTFWASPAACQDFFLAAHFLGHFQVNTHTHTLVSLSYGGQILSVHTENSNKVRNPVLINGRCRGHLPKEESAADMTALCKRLMTWCKKEMGG